MKYLITGGAGFVGSHLAEALLEAGHHVAVIDDLSTGQMENILHLKDNPDFEYVIDTISNEPVLAEMIDLCDRVYHLAAAVGVKLIVESPVRTIETNIHGTELVLKHADTKKKKVLLTSTSEVYGKKEEVPYRETDDLLFGPTTKSRWSYACSKAIDEFLALSYYRERGLPVVIVRLFNTVGPRQVGHYGMVIPRFVNQALDGGPITVYGDGKQTRSFACVTDVVNVLLALMDDEKAVGEVYNIGSDQEISIEDLAGMVRDMVDPAVEITHVPYDKAYEEGFEDLRRRVPDVSKVRALTGFAPTATVSEILEKVIEYEKSKRASG
jgi:UDP-glucose 4-epimerase